MKQTTIDILDRLAERYPALAPLHVNIFEAFQTICKAYNNGGVLYVCGNGGSAADAEHIVGELMKSFRKKRPADAKIQESLTQPVDPGEWRPVLVAYFVAQAVAVVVAFRTASGAVNLIVFPDIFHNYLSFVPTRQWIPRPLK